MHSQRIKRVRPLPKAALLLLIPGLLAQGSRNAGAAPMTTVSSECALAISLALEDLKSWHASQERARQEEFYGYFRKTFGELSCTPSSSKIAVYIFPKDAETLGGAVNYTINSEGTRIIERVFDR